METLEVLPNRPQPLPRPPVLPRPSATLRPIGSVRLPIAGAYRPRARLYVEPDGTRVWRVRLWEVDRAVVHWIDTETLRGFARRNRLRALEAELDALLAHAGARRCP